MSVPPMQCSDGPGNLFSSLHAARSATSKQTYFGLRFERKIIIQFGRLWCRTRTIFLRGSYVTRYFRSFHASPVCFSAHSRFVTGFVIKLNLTLVFFVFLILNLQQTPCLSFGTKTDWLMDNSPISNVLSTPPLKTNSLQKSGSQLISASPSTTKPKFTPSATFSGRFQMPFHLPSNLPFLCPMT